MTLSFKPFAKAPNLLYLAIVEYMRFIVNQHKQGPQSIHNPEQLKSILETEVTRLISDGPEHLKQIKFTMRPHPQIPDRIYINLVWDMKERTVVLAQITCVLQKGGEHDNA